MSNLREQDKWFWHAFLKAYFGNDCRIDEIEEEIRPFVA